MESIFTRLQHFVNEFTSSRLKKATDLFELKSEYWDDKTQFDINSIRRLLDASQGFNTSADNIRSILESDFCPKVNPVQEYFRPLPGLHAEDNSRIYPLSGWGIPAESRKVAGIPFKIPASI